MTAWERRTRLWALVFAALTLAVSALVAMAVIRAGQPAATTLVLALAPAVGVYVWQTGKIRRRHAILREPFPPEWEVVLQRDVLFFRVLQPEAQQRFRRQLQVFLGEKQITGIGVAVDATTRVLVAASAIIPIFGFPTGSGTRSTRYSSTRPGSTATSSSATSRATTFSEWLGRAA